MKARAACRVGWSALAALIALPFVYRDPYHLHILVLILIWSFAYTSWSMMGRFGLVSLGHGGFMGVGAYVTALLWNHLGLSPWIGIPDRLVAAGVLALIVGYPCFPLPHHRALFRAGDAGAVGHRAAGHHRHARLYRRLARLHAEPRTKGSKLLALQFDDKTTWYLIALGVWVVGPADLALGRPQHGPLRAGGDLGGRGRRRRRRRQRHRGEAEDHA